jgi:diaminohydroxyphosphoribosylaminopyrimidine deaminase/5-amino-6-(5-phosphoribosylamino)uracil reductase
MSDVIHEKYMQIAISLAKRGLGNVAPNPTVGCVIVKDNRIISSAVTDTGGRPHAEALALKGKDVSGATAYVTLEPCCHYGKTPPCTEAIINSGIKKVVIAALDPYFQVAGQGIRRLKDAQIEVIYGVCEEQAKELNSGFFYVQEKARPYVTLKLAISADNKIADSSGHSKWITCERTRQYAHYIRALNDAVMIGSGTLVLDDPQLTCRLPGMFKQSPVRVVLDNNLAIKKDSKLVTGYKRNLIPVWVITSAGKNDDILNKIGVKIFNCTDKVDILEALNILAKQGITRLLVEGGSSVASSFIKEDVVDEFVVMRSKKIIGADGIEAIRNFDLADVLKSKFRKISKKSIEDDIVEIYKKIL